MRGYKNPYDNTLNNCETNQVVHKSLTAGRDAIPRAESLLGVKSRNFLTNQGLRWSQQTSGLTTVAFRAVKQSVEFSDLQDTSNRLSMFDEQLLWEQQSPTHEEWKKLDAFLFALLQFIP